jgi:SPP1 family predicted phage head-tail adaptor
MRNYRKTEEIGRMDERVELQYVTQEVNAYGERLETWNMLAAVWTRVQYGLKQSKEDEIAGKEAVKADVTFTIRNRTDVDEFRRVFHSGRLFDIIGIEVTDDKQFQLLRCKSIGVGVRADPGPGFPVAGQGSFRQAFTNVQNNAVTVTVNAGVLPDNIAQVFVFVNGQYTELWSKTGSVITLDFDIFDSETVVIIHFYI